MKRPDMRVRGSGERKASAELRIRGRGRSEKKKSIFSSRTINMNVVCARASNHDLNGLKGDNREFDIR